MHEKPADAVRAKPDSSLVRAVRAVGDGDAAAVVSAGNTGAVLAASLLHVRRLPGVLRPGIAIVIPSRRGPTVLIDAGANADARPEHLVQFAHMGVVFAEERPRRPRPLRAAPLDRRGAREGKPAHARGARPPRRGRSPLRREHGGPRPARGRCGRGRVRRLHGQRRPEDPRGHDPEPPRGASLRDPLVRPRARRRPAHPSRGAGAPGSARSRDDRRRVPPRPPGPRRHRARLELPGRDRERDEDGRAAGSSTASWNGSPSGSRAIAPSSRSAERVLQTDAHPVAAEAGLPAGRPSSVHPCHDPKEGARGGPWVPPRRETMGSSTLLESCDSIHPASTVRLRSGSIPR